MMSDPLILGLDTSSKTTSIAVRKGEHPIKSIASPPGDVRSETLWAEISSLLSEAGAAINDIDLFAVCAGPGGFTGLRVGMAAAKGFALALMKPVIGVTALEAAALESFPAPLVCAMVNAYKEDVYWQIFSFDSDGLPVAESEASVSSRAELFNRVMHIESLVFAGDGVTSGEAFINAATGEGFSDGISSRQGWSIKRVDELRADSIARLAFKRYIRGESETSESLRACYIRPAEAEIKLSLGLLGSKIRRSMRSDDSPAK